MTTMKKKHYKHKKWAAQDPDRQGPDATDLWANACIFNAKELILENLPPEALSALMVDAVLGDAEAVAKVQWHKDVRDYCDMLIDGDNGDPEKIADEDWPAFPG